MVGLIREVAILFDAPGEYSIDVACSEDQIFVSGDRDQLRRALVNIIRNAAQAIQNQADGAIQVKLEVQGQKLIIVVSDNGPGISETDRHRLFEPNFTTKSGGMGLGLAITKSILENYKGEVSFQSEPGKTTFFLEFPLSDL
jgi:signal transduction histidine kinase